MRTRLLARCDRCTQPLPVCICDLVAPIAVETPVLVLVHHFEAHKTTNTGRLAALALHAAFARWGDPEGETPALPEGKVLLLFPSETSRPLTPEDALGAPTLVVPDGTWRQARKIARRVEMACGDRVVRVRVEPTRPSGYFLRKSRRDGALATFEAIAMAVATLEGARGQAIEAQLLALFDGFVARQSAFAGRPIPEVTAW